MRAIFQRKRFFLSDSSQPRLLLTIEVLFFFLLIVSGGILYLVFNQDLTTAYFQAHLRVKNAQEILLPTLVLVNLGGLSVSVVLMLFYTHRIAGPVYRLCRILREVGHGNLIQSVAFRRNDSLKELEQATVDMLSGLNERVRHLQTNARGASALTAVLLSAHPNLSVELEHLRETLAELESDLDRFQLPSDQHST